MGLLKAELYCYKCKKLTIHVWVGMDDGLWIFKCTKCGDETFSDSPSVEWIDERGEAEEK